MLFLHRSSLATTLWTWDASLQRSPVFIRKKLCKRKQHTCWPYPRGWKQSVPNCAEALNACSCLRLSLHKERRIWPRQPWKIPRHTSCAHWLLLYQARSWASSTPKKISLGWMPFLLVKFAMYGCWPTSIWCKGPTWSFPVHGWARWCPPM